MKTKQSILYVLAALLTTSCGGQKGSADSSEAFATDSVGCELLTEKAEVKVYADYPTAGNDGLVDALREFICDELGVGSQFRHNGDSAVREAASIQYSGLEDSWNTLAPYGEGKPTLHSHLDISLDTETGKYVTYVVYAEDYQGGAHGMHTERGVTFRKSDGRRFGWDLLKNTDSTEFLLLMKDGLRQYFMENHQREAATDEGLAALLITDNDLNHLPLPESLPYLTREGVWFTYQPYEIAPYAAGIPSFLIDYERLEPFLTSAAEDLVKE